MAAFPRIDKPCPYKSSLSAIMDGDTCRVCKRQVFDITTFSDEARTAFLRGRAEEVYVFYKFPVRVAVAALMVAGALAAPMAAAAQDFDENVIIVGGITDPANATLVADPRDESVPELPVVYDDQNRAPAANPARDGGQPTSTNSPSALAAHPDLSQSLETK